MTEDERSGRRIITGVGVIALVPSLSILAGQLARGERPLSIPAAIAVAVYFALTASMWRRSRIGRALAVFALGVGAGAAIISLMVDRHTTGDAVRQILTALLFGVMAFVLSTSKQVEAYLRPPAPASAPTET